MFYTMFCSMYFYYVLLNVYYVFYYVLLNVFLNSIFISLFIRLIYARYSFHFILLYMVLWYSHSICWGNFTCSTLCIRILHYPEFWDFLSLDFLLCSIVLSTFVSISYGKFFSYIIHFAWNFILFVKRQRGSYKIDMDYILWYRTA